MSCDNINICTGNDNIVNVISSNNNILAINECDCSVVNIPQSVTTVLQVNATGPQGIQGIPGPTGSAFPYSGIAVITGSLLVSGSGIIVTGSIQQSGSVIFSGLSSSAQSFVVTYNTSSGQLFYTASSAIGGTGGSGAGFPYSGSAVITGSLTVSGSSTFTNIGPAKFKGNFEVTSSGDITRLSLKDKTITTSTKDGVGNDVATGFKLNFETGDYYFGDYGGVGNNGWFQIAGGEIMTTHFGSANANGLYIDNNCQRLGDVSGGTNRGMKLELYDDIDITAYIKTQFDYGDGVIDRGLYLDFQNSTYYLGDSLFGIRVQYLDHIQLGEYEGAYNSTTLRIDESQQLIYTTGGESGATGPRGVKIDFNTDYYTFWRDSNVYFGLDSLSAYLVAGVNLLAAGVDTPSPYSIPIRINNFTYYIQLFIP